MTATCMRLPVRTQLAWEALARPRALGRRAHALLLLTNGRRSLRELRRLLGEDPDELVARLCAQGYLQDATRTETAAVDEDALGA